MKYYFEKYYPFFSGVIFGIVFYFIVPKLNDIILLMDKLTDATLIVSATFVGFFLTITTVLKSINTRRMRFLKDQRGMGQVIGYLHNAIWLNMAALALSITYPFIQKLIVEESCIFLYVLHVFILTWAWASSFRFSYLFLKLIGGDD